MTRGVLIEAGFNISLTYILFLLSSTQNLRKENNVSKPGGFFDLDGTFVRWQWSHAWIVALANAGLIERVVLDRTDEALVAYRKRQGDFDVFVNEMVQTFFDEERLVGVRVSDVEYVSQRLAVDGGDYVHVFARELNEAARELGYVCAIVTGSPTIAARAFADKHGIPIVLGTNLPNDGQRYTGGNVSHWMGRKHIAVQQIAKEHDIDLSRSFAIGDSEGDAKMFERVGYPIAFNPNMGLKRLAHGKWPIVVERKLIYATSWSKKGRYVQADLVDCLPAPLGEALTNRLNKLELLA